MLAVCRVTASTHSALGYFMALQYMFDACILSRVTASSHIALGYLLVLLYLYDACSRVAVSPHLLIALGYSGLAVHVWCFSSLSVCMLPCLGYFLPWRCRSVAIRIHIICLFAVLFLAWVRMLPPWCCRIVVLTHPYHLHLLPSYSVVCWVHPAVARSLCGSNVSISSAS